MTKKTFDNPDSQEREYTRLLLRYTRALRADINALLLPQISTIKRQYNESLKQDSWTDVLNTILAQLESLGSTAAALTISKLPDQFTAVSKFNDRQFALVLKANTGLALPPTLTGNPAGVSLGVNVFRSEPYLSTLAEGWIAENTALIKSIPTTTLDQIRGDMLRGITNGNSVADLSATVKSRMEMSDNRAKLIAQDQTLKLNANLTQYRLESVGVKKYIWRTVNDSRVRDSHAAKNGNIYSFGDGNPKPGEAVRCRCRAEGIFDD